ncbi:hypothetical protein FZEAL_8851 [Fusarium zealandicum]|uniref:Uncharacterized protein n=1 Tax=Fusarium zealandicum TaxID=1053134 RepID=A0A8H4UDZ7_9HYPO|nr:hypothetical protein FZEAL_8851 [Fusarium zealandicum]
MHLPWVMLILLSTVVAQTCYFPSGRKADKKYKPCGSGSTTYSICCAIDQGERCLTNGLCSWPNHYDYRAACTDKDWSGCQDVCPGKSNNTWIRVKECASNEYCCNGVSDKDCCPNKSGRFSLESPRVKSSSASNESSSSTPVGAIAGGVVGGVAGLSIVLGAVWWFLRRRRRASSIPVSTLEAKGTGGKPSDDLPSLQRGTYEADAGPGSVLVESDARPIAPRVVHELHA